MRDAEWKLLLDSLYAAYRDVNPDLTENGAHLCRQLAEGLYDRGARMRIGEKRPPVYVDIHQSLSPLGHIVWTSKKWNEIMGYRNREAIGKHISTFLTPDSYEHFRDFVWPALVAHRKIEGVTITLVRKTGEIVPGTYKSEVLRDSVGGFERTFGKIKVTLEGWIADLTRGAAILLLASCIPTNHDDLSPAARDFYTARSVELERLASPFRPATDVARRVVKPDARAHRGVVKHDAGPPAVRQKEPTSGVDFAKLNKRSHAGRLGPRRQYVFG